MTSPITVDPVPGHDADAIAAASPLPGSETAPLGDTVADAAGGDADQPVDDALLSLPLDAWHRARGGRMVPFAGYHMPVQYDGILAEHLWTRDSAGLFDVSHMGQLELHGPGAVAALETVVPGDIAVLKPGRMRYSLLLAPDGGILDDLMVSRFETHVGIVVNGAVKQDDIAYLMDALPEDVTLRYRDDLALFALQGPRAVDALARLVPGVAAMVFMDVAAFDWNGVALTISRSGYTGEDGFEISVPDEAAEALADALVAQPEVRPVGLGARDSLRLEAGLPLYGHDLDPAITPIAGDLGFAINKRRKAEGGFAGAQRVLAELTVGAPTRRVGLAVEGRLPVREGAALFAGDVPVGTATSGGFAPSLDRPIAMGHVDAAHAAPGTRLEAVVRGRRVAVTVATLPFVPHRYVRQKG